MYGVGVDMWAVGCILAELLLRVHTHKLEAKGRYMLLRFSKNADVGTPSSPWNALYVLSVSPRRAFDGLTCTS